MDDAVFVPFKSICALSLKTVSAVILIVKSLNGQIYVFGRGTLLVCIQTRLVSVFSPLMCCHNT